MIRTCTVACVFVLITYSNIGLQARAQSVDLTQGVWTLLGQDLSSWSGSHLKFTAQSPQGGLTGYFDWVSNDQSRYGRELFNGMLLPDLSFTLHGYEHVAHPVYGPATGVELADYTGRVTADGKRIVDGTWIVRSTGLPGTWESVFVPEPSAALLVSAGVLNLLAYRRQPRLSFGAGGRSRTDTPVRVQQFNCSASTSFATPAPA